MKVVSSLYLVGVGVRREKSRCLRGFFVLYTLKQPEGWLVVFHDFSFCICCGDTEFLNEVAPFLGTFQ